MKEECLICKATLKYNTDEKPMKCVLCSKIENSNTSCINGHYVCNECHTKGIDQIINICLNEKSDNPIHILDKIMILPFCHMHGPEHHIIVGSALLTAYKNAGGNVDLKQALLEMQSRGKRIPGGSCGFWGACGAGISSGMFISIITKATPLSGKEWGLSNLMTAQSLKAISEFGGPRCCKRNSYTAILTAVEFVKSHFGVQMSINKVECTNSYRNNQCIKVKCKYFKGD